MFRNVIDFFFLDLLVSWARLPIWYMQYLAEPRIRSVPSSEFLIAFLSSHVQCTLYSPVWQDLQFFRAFYDHKKIYLRRNSYICSNGYRYTCGFWVSDNDSWLIFNSLTMLNFHLNLFNLRYSQVDKLHIK